MCINFLLIKMPDNEKTIYTIGHSTRDINTFIEILQTFNIALVADVRSYPGSRKYPHFNKENLQNTLKDVDIKYEHFPELGGRRKPVAESKNSVWHNDSFRGYADYMEQQSFTISIEKLEQKANEQNVAYMCAEAVWWHCHRSLISDFLKSKRWKVIHILEKNKSEEHPYTKPAKIVNGRLTYKDDHVQRELF